MTREDRIPILELSFKVGEAFPSADGFAVSLGRLLAATNDVILLQKLTIIARERAESAAGAERTVLNNETGYFVRMLFGHLYEAGIVFRGLDDAHRARIDGIISGDDEAKEALSTLRTMFDDVSDKGFYRSILGCVRNLAGFHYKEDTFRNGLESLRDEDVALLISEHIGFTRYVLSDVIMTAKVIECIGGEGNFPVAVGRAYALADALAIGVTHLLKDLLEEQKVPMKEGRDSVQLPPEIAESKRKIDEARSKG